MPANIASLQNRKIKDAVKLRTRRGRETQQRIIIDGSREIRRGWEARAEFVEVFYCEQLDQLQLELLSQLRAAGVQTTSTTDVVFGKIAFGERLDGLIAIAATPQTSLDQLIVPQRPLVVVIESIEKPGNVGAVLRTADAAGVDAVILSNPVSDLYNPNTIRASLGAVFTIPVAVASNSDTIDWVRSHCQRIVAARVDANSDYRQLQLTGGVAIVLGGEAEGLSSDWQAEWIQSISLPMQGAVDSLNISVTAAVLMYEALRQRTLDEQ